MEKDEVIHQLRLIRCEVVAREHKEAIDHAIAFLEEVLHLPHSHYHEECGTYHPPDQPCFPPLPQTPKLEELRKKILKEKKDALKTDKG